MKVILMKDVKGMGRAYDEVVTADGHAMNYLIPRGLAVVATLSATRDAELRRKQAISRADLDTVLLTQNIEKLAEARIVLTRKANEKGHLYDAIDVVDIVRAAKEQADIDLTEDAVKLEKPIKELGVFDIPVATADTFGKFSITIEAE